MALSLFYWKAVAARRKHARRAAQWAGVLALLIATGASASSVLSQSLRVSVRGMDSSVNLDWAMWAEHVLTRYATWTGYTPAFRREAPLRLFLTSQAGEPEGVVYTESVWERGTLHQQMLMINPQHIADETALYGLVQLLLDRQASARMPESARTDDVFRIAPGWLTVGVAGQLFSALRGVQQRAAAHALREGLPTDPVRVLAYARWEDVPVQDEVWCTMLVAWLQGRVNNGQGALDLLHALAEGRTLNEQTLLEMTGYPDARALRMAFFVWLTHQAQIVDRLGSVSRADVERLKQRLIIRGDRFDALGIPGVPSTLAPHELIEQRAEPWAEAVAMHMAFDIHAQGLGKAQAFREVTDAYGTFFAWVQRAAMDRRLIKLGGYVSEKKLMRYYREARAAMLRLENSLDRPSNP